MGRQAGGCAPDQGPADYDCVSAVVQAPLVERELDAPWSRWHACVQLTGPALNRPSLSQTVSSDGMPLYEGAPA
jgi:hypothetical protein